MPRLIFYDIDGTLIDPATHRVPPDAAEAMRQARRNGCLNIINTGRTLCNMDARLDGLPVDGWVLGCGTRIRLGEETLTAFSYSPEESAELRERILRSGLSAVYEGDEAIWLEESYDRNDPLIEGMRAYAMRMGIGRVVHTGDPAFAFVKIFIVEREEARVRRLLEALDGRLEGIRRRDTGSGWELVPAGFSKGTGIDVIRERLGVPPEDCYVIGDSANDLSMLEHVPNSIAMGNAEEDVKRICAYVTAAAGDGGIAQALAHYGLSGVT